MPLTRIHKCDMPIRWSHLSTAECHFNYLSYTTSFLVCLFRSLSVSSNEIIRRFWSCSSASDLSDGGRADWKFRMWPAGIKRPLASFDALLNVFSACTTVQHNVTSSFSSGLCRFSEANQS